MNDEQRAEIIRRFYGGTSFRRIARALDVDRKTVAKVVAAHQNQRGQPHSALQPPVRRSSLLGRWTPSTGQFWWPGSLRLGQRRTG